MFVNDVLITLLADGPAKTGPDVGKASPVGLLVVVLLLIGVFALVWSMNRHLRKVPASFDDDATVTQAETPGAPSDNAEPPRDFGSPRESGG